jgi:cation:H+ antiporter
LIKDIEHLTEEAARNSALQSIWTFPSMVFAALVIAWGAESAQFLVSQAFALTMLALIQTLPEFAVEGFIAWNAGANPTPANIGLMTANFTGALRLLVGLGWPLIYTTTVIFNLRRSGRLRVAEINLESEHSVELMGLLAGSIYAFVIVLKGSLTLLDTLLLLILYGSYIALLLRLPPKDEEHISDLEMVPRYILTRAKWYRNLLIWACFIFGGVGIILVAEPFLESALGLSFVMGVPAFMLIQWLAPFLSEFPEKISAFYWAKSIVKAPMALMNMVSSGIAELTLLISIIPIIFCISLGHVEGIQFDWPHRAEIMLTATQGILGFVLLSNMNFRWFEAVGLFVLWFTQIFFQYQASQVIPPVAGGADFVPFIWNILHAQVLERYTIVYWIWILLQFFLTLRAYRGLPIFSHFKIAWATRRRNPRPPIS